LTVFSKPNTDIHSRTKEDQSQARGKRAHGEHGGGGAGQTLPQHESGFLAHQGHQGEWGVLCLLKHHSVSQLSRQFGKQSHYKQGNLIGLRTSQVMKYNQIFHNQKTRKDWLKRLARKGTFLQKRRRRQALKPGWYHACWCWPSREWALT
jgi:hypothetical protein